MENVTSVALKNCGLIVAFEIVQTNAASDHAVIFLVNLLKHILKGAVLQVFVCLLARFFVL